MESSTRALILQKNYEAMRKHGFQGVRADKVIAELGITKGALYHYFPTKLDLGYAIVEEIIRPGYEKTWESLHQHTGHCLDALGAFLDKLVGFTTADQVCLGCPLMNLMQEMSPLDEGFRLRLAEVLASMHRELETHLVKGQERGEVSKLVPASHLAWMILATVEGGFGLSKTRVSPETFAQIVFSLKTLLNPLRQ